MRSDLDAHAQLSFRACAQTSIFGPESDMDGSNYRHAVFEKE